MSQDAKLPAYQSYLLRCWLLSPADDGVPARWRFLLREVAAEPTELIFRSAAELTDYLEKVLSAVETNDAK